MQYLILAILCSASMALVLKLFRAQRGNRFGIILGNYFTCILISLLVMPDRSLILSGDAATFLCGALGGVLFVAGLVFMQSSIRLSGAMLTSAFSRLGLLVSLAVSIACFGERPGIPQILGIALVLCAILLINGAGGRGKKQAGGLRSSHAALLLATLLSCGGGDAMAKVFEQVGNRTQDTLYFFCLFVTAAILSAILAFIEWKRTGKRILPAELAAGVAVGIPNYFSSYLLLQSLLKLPAFLVYPVFSTGALLLVMAVSALCFRERPGKRQLAGIGLILAALVLLNL